MIIIDKVSLFVNISDEIKLIKKADLKKMLNLQRFKSRELKLTIEEYLTLIILFNFSDNRCLKSFWYKETQNIDFRNIPSYNTFTKWFNRLGLLLKSILDKYLTAIEQGIGYVDSTKIITCSNHWNGKIHRESSYGYSSTVNFKGFKLTVLINDKKLISNYCITTASTHDLAILQDNKLFKGQQGLIYGDSGYVSKDFYEECKINNIEFIAKPRNNMNPYFDWEKYKGFYKGRLKIERLFSIFKTRMNMNVTILHSTKVLYTRIYSTLVSWQLLKLNFFNYKII